MLDRLKEPSTWASIAALLGLFGVPLAPEIVQPLMQIGAGAAAIAGVLLHEKS